MAVAELINNVRYAAWAGKHSEWTDSVVFDTEDKVNAHHWLTSRRCKHRCAAVLLLTVCAMVSTYCFETPGADMRAYHDVTADAITRLAKAEVADLMLARVDLEGAWSAHLESRRNRSKRGAISGADGFDHDGRRRRGPPFR